MEPTTQPDLAERARELGTLGFSPGEVCDACGMTRAEFTLADGGGVWRAYLTGRTEAQCELRRTLLDKARSGRIGAARALLAFHDRGEVDFEALDNGTLQPAGAGAEIAKLVAGKDRRRGRAQARNPPRQAQDLRYAGFTDPWPRWQPGGLFVSGTAPPTPASRTYRERWDGAPLSNYQIQAASVVKHLGTIVPAVPATESEALEYAIKCQTNRRNLTDAEILRCVQELDKRRTKAEAAKVASDVAAGTVTQPCVTEGPSSAATAATIGISQRKVEQARTVLDHAPEPIAGDSRGVSPRPDADTRNATGRARRAASRAAGGDPARWDCAGMIAIVPECHVRGACLCFCRRAGVSLRSDCAGMCRYDIWAGLSKSGV